MQPQDTSMHVSQTIVNRKADSYLISQDTVVANVPVVHHPLQAHLLCDNVDRVR